ncbi:hypothetical protein TVAG_459770 [Trichomonas vaginalis G3]|uniref:Uncharacterized protein n=1 Tax=Trichomonas vaginalis (strain ATCC PRA-98 / G3) TaxID=412133 RepID=A2G2G2_TRIV3|nr:hypothetical protein TVAGG3_0930470 [Trichomonas vaginalis G3]EAX88662.1 hypothetical protein TVAG_459770 [Trichomonas vaginalis G3]KAI5485798.1 hypothetical protein TVAGG3_0930470 [Trichomonas vaginalis G3]|eukprot:XP_001301592.1 hypothetical protein [Trichomonas vaginalis G3]
MRKGNTEQKRNDLWKAMLKLMSLTSDPENDEIDGAVQELFVDDPPFWLNNHIVFGSLVAAFDKDIEIKVMKLKSLQKRVEHQIKVKNADEIRKQNVLSEIQKIESDLATESTDQSADTFSTNVDSQIQEYDRLCREKRQDLQALEEECDQLEKYYDEVEQELTKQKNVRDIYQQHLLDCSKIIRDFRKQNEKIRLFLQTIISHRNALHQTQKDLIITGDKLIKARADNEKTIKKLEDKYGEHQQLVQKLEETEIKIKQAEQQQEMTLTKMIEAVKTSEQAKAEVSKQSAVNLKLSNEIQRIRNLTREKSQQLSRNLDEHCKGIERGYANALSEITTKIKEIETENKETVQDRAVVQRRLDLATQENQKLVDKKGDNGFQEFLNEMRRLKDDSEEVILKIDEMKVNSNKFADGISSVKTKIVQISRDCRDELQLLEERGKNLEEEVKVAIEQRDEVITTNERISAENRELRKQIVQAHSQSKIDMENAMNDKEEEIDEMKKQIERAVAESSRAVENITAAAAGYKQHADKWRCQMDIINAEAAEVKSNTLQRKQSKSDEYKSLRTRAEDLSKQSEEMKFQIAETDREIALLKSEIAERDSGIRKAKRRIRGIEQVRMDFTSQIQELKRMQKGLDQKIQKYGSELYLIQAENQ